jgi:ribosomal 50S subunit-associated protein YjgA (DUF615 family)
MKKEKIMNEGNHKHMYTLNINLKNEQGTPIVEELFEIPTYTGVKQSTAQKLEAIRDRIAEDLAVAKYGLYERIKTDMKV